MNQKELNLVELELFGEMQMNKQSNGLYENLITIEQKIDDSIGIVNPFLDETGRISVNPYEYYGRENFENWSKKVIEFKELHK